MLQSRTQAALKRMGFIVQRWPPEGSLDRELQRLIVDQQIDTILDIGAHIGRYGAKLRAIGFGGRIISFEPSPEPFERLCAGLDAMWEAHALAVGDEEGVATLHVYATHEEFSSLHEPTPLGFADWALDRRRNIKVPIRRLDNLVSGLGVDPKRSLIKIDTQGHDAAVMSGGSETIGAAAGLQLELPASLLYEGAAPFDELVRRAQSLGFAPLGFFPVHDHPRPLIPIEFDGLFIREAYPECEP